MKAIARVAMAAALALAFVPGASSAHEEHCYDVFVLSGADTGSGRAGTNPGALTCAAHDPEVPVATNTTVPGATHAWAASFIGSVPVEGYVSINGGEPQELTFFHETVRNRWESNSVDLTGVLPGSTLAFTVDFGDDNIQTVVYTRI